MVLCSGIQFGHSEQAWRLGLLMTSLESLYELKIQAVCFGNPMVLCLPVKGDPDTLENQSSDCCELVSLTHIHITHPDPSDCCGSTATNIFFSGWCFGTCFMTFHSVGNVWNVIIPTDELHHFSRWLLHHQPDYY